MNDSVKERPILFSGPMVRAILEGRKTQTRRVIKSPYKDEHGKPSKGPFEWVETPEGSSACLDLSGDGYDENGDQMSFRCPYGSIGDLLWVRETWCHHAKASTPWFGYRSDGDYRDLDYRWRPSIHMPRCASRITLEVTGVRAERLFDISDNDARSEGFESVMEFARFWDSIAKPGAKWADNTWVFVITFKRI